MAALLALTFLVVSNLSNLVIAIGAVISEVQRRGSSLLLCMTLFLTLTVLLSMFSPSPTFVVMTKSYLAVFLSGVIEECVKAFCLLLFCGRALTTSSLLNKSFIANPIWPFALLVGLIENTQMFIQPIVVSLIEIYHESLTLPDLNTASAVQFYTPVGVALLASTALPRIILHFGFAWLFILFWRMDKAKYAFLIALLHGGVNALLLYIGLQGHEPLMHMTHMSVLYFSFAILLGLALVYVRRIYKNSTVHHASRFS